MLNAFSKFFAPKTPTTEIAGVALAYDDAVQLIHTCTSLKHALNLQVDAVGKLPSVPNEQISSNIRQLQTRHIDIQIYLTSIVFKTRGSNVSWIHEFVDARLALEKKIVSINSRSRKLGWLVTARQCWPGVAETYVWLSPVVIRLQSELRQALKQKELWSADIPLQTCEEVDTQQEELAAMYTEYPHVLFEKEVVVQEYQVGMAIGEQHNGQPYSVTLTDDRKRTAGKFKGKRARYRDRTDEISDSSL